MPSLVQFDDHCNINIARRDNNERIINNRVRSSASHHLCPLCFVGLRVAFITTLHSFRTTSAKYSFTSNSINHISIFQSHRHFVSFPNRKINKQPTSSPTAMSAAATDQQAIVDATASSGLQQPQQLIQIRNVRLLRDHRLHTDLDLWVRNGRIIDPERVFFDERRCADRVIDGGGAICCAGFIDLQINGGYGIDFSNIAEGRSVAEGVRMVARELLAHGVTAFCPTLVTSPAETYRAVLPQIRRTQGSATNGASVLGTHLEGPFISAEKKGAHPEQHIRDFGAHPERSVKDDVDDQAEEESKTWQTLCDVYGEEGIRGASIVTMAVEKPRAKRAVELLSKCGVTVAQGHSMAHLRDGEEGVRRGAGLITHLFNAMLPFHHRDPGLVGLLTSDALPAGRTVHFGIIADGCHTHPAALRIAYRSHPLGLCLVTDAIAGLGLPDGVHMLGQLQIEVRQKKAYLVGTQTLCGSIASMDECVRLFWRATGCTREYALEAASLHPARALGREAQKGSLAFGADADFVLLDDDLRVLTTWIAGEQVYDNAKTTKADGK